MRLGSKRGLQDCSLEMLVNKKGWLGSKKGWLVSSQEM